MARRHSRWRQAILKKKNGRRHSGRGICQIEARFFFQLSPDSLISNLQIIFL